MLDPRMARLLSEVESDIARLREQLEHAAALVKAASEKMDVRARRATAAVIAARSRPALET